MFDWENLRHFATFAATGSLSAAARSLSVDHVTVARRIAALEETLGLRLVDRRPRSYALTANGERVVKLADAMMDSAFQLERLALANAPEPLGKVTVSAPPAAAIVLVAPKFASISSRFPGLEIELLTDVKIVSLSRREADIALRLSRPKGGELVARKIGVINFGLYGTADHVARPGSDWRFVGYDQSMMTSIQHEWLEAVRENRPLSIRSNDLLVQANAVRAGVGLGVLPDFLVAQEDALSRVDTAIKMQREVWAAMHRDVQHSVPVRAVLEFLSECFR